MAKRGKGSVSIRELHEKTGELVRRAGASSVRRANCICRFLKACFYARATVYTSSRRCMKGSEKSARSIATSKRRCRHLVSLLLPSSLHALQILPMSPHLRILPNQIQSSSRAASQAALQRENLTSALACEIFGLKLDRKSTRARAPTLWRSTAVQWQSGISFSL